VGAELESVNGCTPCQVLEVACKGKTYARGRGPFELIREDGLYFAIADSLQR
jgi:hypothetical protein